MKNLELNQIEIINGGYSDEQTAVCGISIGLMFYPPTFMFGAVGFAFACLT